MKASSALIWVLAVPVGLICGVMALVLGPEVGLFGDANQPAERIVGVACALATGPLLVAGPLYAGVRNRDVSVLLPVGLVALVVSITVAATAL